jgi:hypothetical protein
MFFLIVGGKTMRPAHARMDAVTFVTFRAAIGPSPGHHANEKGRPRMGTPFRKPVGTKRSGAA